MKEEKREKKKNNPHQSRAAPAGLAPNVRRGRLPGSEPSFCFFSDGAAWLVRPARSTWAWLAAGEPTLPGRPKAAKVAPYRAMDVGARGLVIQVLSRSLDVSVAWCQRCSDASCTLQPGAPTAREHPEVGYHERELSGKERSLESCQRFGNSCWPWPGEVSTGLLLGQGLSLWRCFKYLISEAVRGRSAWRTWRAGTWRMQSRVPGTTAISVAPREADRVRCASLNTRNLWFMRVQVPRAARWGSIDDAPESPVRARRGFVGLSAART